MNKIFSTSLLLITLCSCGLQENTSHNIQNDNNSSSAVTLNEKINTQPENTNLNSEVIQEKVEIQPLEVKPTIAYISIKPFTNPRREKDNAYRIYGETSNNCSKIEVETRNANPSEKYLLQKYTKGSTTFTYGIREDWENLTTGLNTYTFTAYCDGNQIKQTSASLNNPLKEPEPSPVIPPSSTLRNTTIPSYKPIPNSAPYPYLNSDVIETKIDGDFEGWDGETIFKMRDGSIWQQDSYNYTYHYAYSPDVLIYKKYGSYYMKVEGVDDTIKVVRLK